jgi:hypothetical protein
VGWPKLTPQPSTYIIQYPTTELSYELTYNVSFGQREDEDKNFKKVLLKYLIYDFYFIFFIKWFMIFFCRKLINDCLLLCHKERKRIISGPHFKSSLYGFWDENREKWSKYVTRQKNVLFCLTILWIVLIYL